MNTIKLAIFDMDGLIFDSETTYLMCAMHISDKYGYGITPDLIKRSMGKNTMAIRALISSEMGPDFPIEEYSQRVAEYEHAYKDEHNPEFKKGFVELLEFLLANNIKTAIATSTKRNRAVQYIQRAGIFDKMDYIICGDDLTESKPNPQIYLKVLEHFNIKAKEALVFEDSLNGLLASYNANINCILVPDIAIVPNEERNKAYHVIESLDKAIDIIKEINNI